MKKTLLAIGLLTLVACAIHAWMNFKRTPGPPDAAPQADSETPSAEPAIASPRPKVSLNSDQPLPVERSTIPAMAPQRPAVAVVPRPVDPALAQMPAIPEPVAREALSWVGVDPAANEVWVAAINDENMPAPARRNLIEDLNETGFADPRNLSLEDLPVIENRIAIIEQLGPNAIDDVNYAAFEEAYKDLLNMRARLVGRSPGAAE